MKYDLIIIGAGPGGYIPAERAGAMGKKVLLIEKGHLGGVCLNEGCVPTKTLLNSAKLYTHGLEAGQFGVHFKDAEFSLKEMMDWKTKVIETMRKGIASSMKRLNVEVLEGEARFEGAGKVSVNGTTHEGENILIATGSSAVVIPIPGADSPKVVTNREILQIEEMPKKLVVIGGGVIGVEFASLFASFGVEVEVIEMLDEIIPLMDPEHSKLLRRALKKQVTFTLGARVESIDDGKVTYSVAGKDGKAFPEKKSVEADLILMAVGRKPNIKGMGFEEAGLDIGKQGIVVDERMRTNLPGVYAAGDVTGKSLLAHSASRMGEVAVNNMFGPGGSSGTGKNDRMRYQAIPWALYSNPEGAGCGPTEAEAKEQGLNVKTSSLQMRVNARFLAENGIKGTGVCKVVVDADTERLIGVHMLGGACSEMIHSAAAMIEAELRVRDIKEIVFPHPTVSEIIRDAVWEIE